MKRIAQVTLPLHYRGILRIDLQHNKKTALLVNISTLIILGVLLLLGFLALYDLSTIKWTSIMTTAAAASVIAYMVLHECIHGIFMWVFSGVRPKFGYTLLYAYTGSDVLFGKRRYMCISLAPLLVSGLLLTVFMVFTPVQVSLLLYIIQCINISGSFGDIYVTYKVSQLPRDILVRDAGVNMAIYCG